jgi:hypothetical protein
MKILVLGLQCIKVCGEKEAPETVMVVTEGGCARDIEDVPKVLLIGMREHGDVEHEVLAQGFTDRR